MTLYTKGAEFERSVIRALVDLGYGAWRCGGSRGMGGVDIVAMKTGAFPLLIQCKVGGYYPGYERGLLCEMAKNVGAIALLATRERGGGVIWQELSGSEQWKREISGGSFTTMLVPAPALAVGSAME